MPNALSARQRKLLICAVVGGGFIVGGLVDYVRIGAETSLGTAEFASMIAHQYIQRDCQRFDVVVSFLNEHTGMVPTITSGGPAAIWTVDGQLELTSPSTGRHKTVPFSYVTTFQQYTGWQKRGLKIDGKEILE